MANKKIRCSQPTFWNKLRVDRGISIEEVADYLHVSPQKAGHYFTGYSLPTDYDVKALCSLFDVDEAVGAREFQQAHREYDIKSRKKAYPPKTVDEAHVQEVLTQAQAFNDRVAERNNPTQPKPEDHPDIFKLVYGVISYEEFNAFFDAVAGKEGDALAMVYGKVSYETFKTIERIIKEG